MKPKPWLQPALAPIFREIFNAVPAPQAVPMATPVGLVIGLDRTRRARTRAGHVEAGEQLCAVLEDEELRRIQTEPCALKPMTDESLAQTLRDREREFLAEGWKIGSDAARRTLARLARSRP